MILNQKTTIGFAIPDEFAQLNDFVKNNDMAGWVRSEDTNFVYLTKTDSRVVHFDHGRYPFPFSNEAVDKVFEKKEEK